MSFPRPFAGLDRRIIWLRSILLSACFLGMLFSQRLWLSNRDYPLLKFTPDFPTLPAPLDKLFFVALLLSLVLAGWFYRKAVLFFLFGTFFLFLGDQNRGQPWFYMYWVMLWLTLLPAPIALSACRWALSAVYLWSGIQKCHAKFFASVPVWLSAPAAHWHLPSGGPELVRYAIASAPFTEIFIGLALWVPRLRKVALGIVVAVHVLALLLLGPTGLNYNLVVWPWNFAMIALAFVLFADAPQARITRAFADLRLSKPGLAAVVLFTLLPILSYVGMWDSYFSFSLFAEHEARADIFMSQAMTERLPEPMRKQIHPLPAGYNPQVQGPYAFGFQVWAFEQLGVPAISEPRSFRSVYNFLYKTYATAPGDVRMLISPRSGPITFYEGNKSFTLTPPK